MAGEVVVRPMREEEAESLAACFRRCYGSSYTGGDFYEPEKIRAHLAADRLRSVVAVAPDGEVVGHMAIAFRDGSRRTADAGNTVVDPRFRGRGLMGRLGRQLMESHSAGLVGYHNYPVTTHTIMQRHTLDGGGIETGLMLAYSPAETVDRGGSKTSLGTGRTAVVVSYQRLAPAPLREVTMPGRYESYARAVYGALAMERSFCRERADLSTEPSALGILMLDRRGVERLTVERAGTDLRRRLEEELASAQEMEIDVVQLDLPLSDSSAEATLAVARRVGFFFSAILPEYRGGDVLRMQYLQPSSGEGPRPKLVGSGSREAQAIIDRERGTLPPR